MQPKDLLHDYVFQKYGFSCNFLWKLLNHCCSVLIGTKDSEGLGVIWAWVSAKDEAKFTKFSNILDENSTKESTLVGAVFGAAVCWDSCAKGSTDIPIWAMCEGCCWDRPKGFSVTPSPENKHNVYINQQCCRGSKYQSTVHRNFTYFVWRVLTRLWEPVKFKPFLWAEKKEISHFMGRLRCWHTHVCFFSAIVCQV